MELWQKIIEAFPTIKASDDFQIMGIFLKDDSDGQGAYIDKWDYSEPMPASLKLGK